MHDVIFALTLFELQKSGLVTVVPNVTPPSRAAKQKKTAHLHHSWETRGNITGFQNVPS
jgi:hypothetical protein